MHLCWIIIILTKKEIEKEEKQGEGLDLPNIKMDLKIK